MRRMALHLLCTATGGSVLSGKRHRYIYYFLFAVALFGCEMRTSVPLSSAAPVPKDKSFATPPVGCPIPNVRERVAEVLKNSTFGVEEWKTPIAVIRDKAGLDIINRDFPPAFFDSGYFVKTLHVLAEATAFPELAGHLKRRVILNPEAHSVDLENRLWLDPRIDTAEVLCLIANTPTVQEIADQAKAGVVLQDKIFADTGVQVDFFFSKTTFTELEKRIVEYRFLIGLLKALDLPVSKIKEDTVFAEDAKVLARDVQPLVCVVGAGFSRKEDAVWLHVLLRVEVPFRVTAEREPFQ